MPAVLISTELVERNGHIVSSLNWNDPIESKFIYKATVYNIEVEDWHTYFVGELGVWVHNANCDGLQVVQNANKFDKALPRSTSKYESRSGSVF